MNINAGCGSTDLGRSRRPCARPEPTSAWRSTATATACWRWTTAGDAGRRRPDPRDLRPRPAREGRLAGDAVVTTTMTNLGFRRAMAAEGIEVRWTDVGDRYVLEEMRQGGFVLGGEQSGHLINLLHGPSGDGLAAALHLLRRPAHARRGPGDGRGGRAAPAAAAGERPGRAQGRPAGGRRVWEAVAACEAALGEDGRVVVRASGTEPLVRVMVEAPTVEDCERWCGEIAEVAGGSSGASYPASAD